MDISIVVGVGACNVVMFEVKDTKPKKHRGMNLCGHEPAIMLAKPKIRRLCKQAVNRSQEV